MIEEGLVLDGVSLWLGERRLIGPLDLTIAPGDVATLMGPSGCGKSSLLAYICGTLDPAFRAKGHVRLGGIDRVLHRTWKMAKTGNVTVSFGAPLHLSGDNYENLAAQVEDAVRKLGA